MRLGEKTAMYDFQGFFDARLQTLRAEDRYRVFADLARRAGAFPRAFHHQLGAEVIVWCSTDYKTDCLSCHLPAEASDWIYVQGYPSLKQ